MHDWQDTTIAGFVAMGSHRHAAAAHLLSASELLGSTEAGDARAAAALSNKGVARYLLAQPEEAEAEFAAAEQAWTSCLAGVATWDVELSGSSSSFHLGLAARNIEAFQNTQRQRIARCCEAGLGITRFNRLLASKAPAARYAHMLAALLSDVLGPRSPEARLLHPSPAAAGCSLYAEKAAELTSVALPLFTPVRSRRNVETALALTVLLRPGFGSETQVPAVTDPHFASTL